MSSGINCGVRKLARTPRVTKKKKLEMPCALFACPFQVYMIVLVYFLHSFMPYIHNPHSLILKPTPQLRGGKLKKKKNIIVQIVSF
jgi:hypothetical protein